MKLNIIWIIYNILIYVSPKYRNDIYENILNDSVINFLMENLKYKPKNICYKFLFFLIGEEIMSSNIC